MEVVVLVVTLLDLFRPL